MSLDDYVTPPTFVADTILEAEDLNILGDDIVVLEGVAQGVVASGAQVRRAATQSISTSSDTDVSFDTENFDYGSWYSSGTTITVPAGAIPDGYTTILVIVVGQVKFATDGTGKRKMSFLKNGTGFGNWKVSALDDDNTSVYLTEFTTAVSGDAFKLQVWQNSGGALNISEARYTVMRYAPVS